ncbi:MAG: eukaryotic translation initiation factor 4E [archaeon]|nr:eukaryotic translation initiation factor 4E [archaeon]
MMEYGEGERRSSGGGKERRQEGGGNRGDKSQFKAFASTIRAKPALEGEHPLEFEWIYWHLGGAGTGARAGTSPSYIPKPIGAFNTVEGFWQFSAHLVSPARLPSGHTYHVFKHPITPRWEDKNNEGGAKWMFQLANGHPKLDAVWQDLMVAAVGETLEEDNKYLVCGLVISRRKPFDKFAVWLRASAVESDAAKRIGSRIAAILSAHDPSIKLAYQLHRHEREQGGGDSRRRMTPSSASSTSDI